MSRIINVANLEDIRYETPGNLQDAIKHTILNIIECSYEKILDSEKFTEANLEEISYRIHENEELNDFIDGLIYEELDKFKEKNEIGEEDLEME